MYLTKLWNYLLHSVFLRQVWQLSQNEKIKLHPINLTRIIIDIQQNGIIVLFYWIMMWSVTVGLGKQVDYGYCAFGMTGRVGIKTQRFGSRGEGLNQMESHFLRIAIGWVEGWRKNYGWNYCQPDGDVLTRSGINNQINKFLIRFKLI